MEKISFLKKKEARGERNLHRPKKSASVVLLTGTQPGNAMSKVAMSHRGNISVS
jgi:hypothetical protein